MPFSQVLISLGDSALAIPLGLCISLALALQKQFSRALRWTLAFAAAIGIVGAGKVGFAVFGWSVPKVGMYVISGHAMLAAAVYPMLFGTLAAALRVRYSRVPALRCATILGMGLGIVLALATMAVLIIQLQHTVSETLLGGAVGAAAAAIGLAGRRQTQQVLQLAPTLALAVAPALVWYHTDMPSPVDTAKKVITRQVAEWAGVEGRYARRIVQNPESGKRFVHVTPPRQRV